MKEQVAASLDGARLIQSLTEFRNKTAVSLEAHDLTELATTRSFDCKSKDEVLITFQHSLPLVGATSPTLGSLFDI